MKRIVILLFVFIPLCLFPQKREVKTIEYPNYVIINQSDTIKDVKHWVYFKSDKTWGNTHSGQYRPEDESQNFSNITIYRLKSEKSIAFAIVFFEQKKVYTLSLSGIIQLNSSSRYRETKSDYFYYFTEDEFYKLVDKIKKYDGESVHINITTWSGLTSGYGDEITRKEIADRAGQSIHNENPKYKKNSSFWIKSEIIDGEKIIRFTQPAEVKKSKGYFKNNYFELEYNHIKLIEDFIKYNKN